MTLFESIKVYDRKLINIEYHNARFCNSRETLFGITIHPWLEDIIQIPGNIGTEVYKCRLEYGKEIFKINFTPYHQKKISSLKKVYCDDINYSHKYTDRSGIASLYQERGKHDDILIIKDGFVTDTSYCNIALFDGSIWITPSTPLLKGSARERLLISGLIKEKQIREQDLKHFSKVSLINAFLDLDSSPIIPISQIW